MHRNSYDTNFVGLPNNYGMARQSGSVTHYVFVYMHVCVCLLVVVGGVFIKQLGIMLTICNVMQSISVGLLE